MGVPERGKSERSRKNIEEIMAKNFLSQFDKRHKATHWTSSIRSKKDKHKDILTVPHYYQTVGRQTENPESSEKKQATHLFKNPL